jgi:hypothetical protein
MRKTLAVLGLLLALVPAAYSQTKPESTTQTKLAATPQTGSQSTPQATASQRKQRPWLRGVWEGTGYQTDDNSTWTMRLTVTRQNGRRVYSIDYPSLDCGGRWMLLSMNSNGARFREQITRNEEKCSQSGLVVLERKRGQVIFLYSNEGSREITATAVLNRKTSKS